VDEYPKTCAAIPKEQACALVWTPVSRLCRNDMLLSFVETWTMIQSTQAGILVKNLTRKKFDRYWEMIDVDQKDGTRHCWAVLHWSISHDLLRGGRHL